MAKEPLKTNGAVKEEPVVETPKRPATKGTSGPPVYYPPNHDMFTKKDAPILVHTIFILERCIVGLSLNPVSNFQSRTLERKSKSKASAKAAEAEGGAGGAYGGAAVIPICLPVCCAMPCVIM